MKTRCTVVVFSGNNQRAVIAFLRVAVPLKADVAIVASGRDDPILLTAYARFVVHVREDRRLDVTELSALLNNIVKLRQCEKLIILPSTEYLNRFLLRYRSELEQGGVQVPLVNADLYSQISDKESFGLLCERHQLKVPRNFPWDGVPCFPVVAKPRRYFAEDGRPLAKPHQLLDAGELDRFCGIVDPAEWYLQEFVAGRSFYLLYWISRIHRHVVFSQENLLQQAGGRSVIAARAATFHHDPIAAQYLRMFESEGFFGFVMVELRLGEYGPVMIEANPRLWGPSQLFVDAKVPIFEQFLYETGAIPHLAEGSVPDNDALYYWSGGLGEKEPDYHGITATAWQGLESQFAKADIYRRNDTIGIWKNEEQ